MGARLGSRRVREPRELVRIIQGEGSTKLILVHEPWVGLIFSVDVVMLQIGLGSTTGTSVCYRDLCVPVRLRLLDS